MPNLYPSVSLRTRLRVSQLAALTLLVLLAGCEPAPDDADVIVVGAGIAGLAAALEAEAAGARVLIVELSSVGGGHAVRAGGFALAGTDLQRAKGIDDDPETARADLLRWGEDGDAHWTQMYAEQSAPSVYDWLTDLGVEFAMVLDTPEDSAPRFHFTRGTAVNAVVPMMRKTLQRDNITWLFNHEVTSISRTTDDRLSLRATGLRTGKTQTLNAPSVVLATGGFQSDLATVRANWPSNRTVPDRLLIGSARFASGAGLELAQSLDAGLDRMDRQATFVNGLPSPRNPARGLKAENPRAIWVNRDGRRFVNERADSKTTTRAVFDQPDAAHWLVFDEDGRKRLIVRDAAWLNRETLANEIIGNPTLVKRAENIAELAAQAGLPADTLIEQITRFNTHASVGGDHDFGRFAEARDRAFTIGNPPFYAVRLYPMTRKSMGGVAIGHDAEVVAANGTIVAGLFAAGELTGVAGINGSHGGSGTFLGPSVLLGRIAGRNAAAGALAHPARNPWPETETTEPDSAGATARQRDASAVNHPAALTKAGPGPDTPGYWHFGVAHALVAERGYACDECHTAEWPQGPAVTTAQRRAQLESCTRCH